MIRRLASWFFGMLFPEPKGNTPMTEPQPAPSEAQDAPPAAAPAYKEGAVFGASITTFTSAATGTAAAATAVTTAEEAAAAARLAVENASSRAQILITNANDASVMAGSATVAAVAVHHQAIRDEIVAAENVQNAATARITDLRALLP